MGTVGCERMNWKEVKTLMNVEGGLRYGKSFTPVGKETRYRYAYVHDGAFRALQFWSPTIQGWRFPAGDSGQWEYTPTFLVTGFEWVIA